MKEKIYFWLKTNLGFSRKESKGFVLLVPVLLILGVSPDLIRFVKNQNSEKIYLNYLAKVDSLERKGLALAASPLPTFNPQDTVRKFQGQRVSERINRINFSEADSITLQIVPGIGPSTASRIVKYRENLGGFRSQSQLKEVYGLKEETIEAIWEYFEFDPSIFRKIQINQLDPQELAKHPYISFQEAKVLVAYRKQHGKFDSPSDLLQIKIFKQEWVDKIGPYLEF
ncbi:helix-hairpin-helix domain-containing protein [Algoriphagus sp. AK58]|uniref:ComEA family DNA-binding protein n=1 Tax=Algoriphagus sp. AK58 TaxID=1406877 RepID=UPI0016504F2B|nr:helix-hairpin-helix domain-containing protein [Algoriphagus sp. AK58]MBC6368818.1 competence protein ComEA [Algoriphagus sp. AK58]